MDKNMSVVISDQLNALDKDKKTLIRDQFCARSGILITSFYYKVRNQKWSPLEIEVLVQLLNSLKENENNICQN
ncbi:MAG: hypothetical protein HDR74_06720 [Bacteroides sp.]|nr:hypothetical protein [Bacteroides sp.]